MLGTLLRSYMQEAEELVLDHWRASCFSVGDRLLVEAFSNLTTLSLNGCGLARLTDFPQLPLLLTLQLCDNFIADGLEALEPLVSLQTLGLSGNLLATVAAVQPLSALRCLKSLDLLECPVASTSGYRLAVFAAVPSLRLLDRSSNDAGFLSAEDSDESESLYDFESCDEDEDEQAEFATYLDEDNGNCVLIDASSSEDEPHSPKV